MNHPDPLISRSPMWRGIRVILLVLPLACFALSPTVRAVDPPPDGGYPNGNTAEGDSAHATLTTEAGNTAVRFQALFSNTSGVSGGNQAGNTAIGNDALFSNTIGP